MQEVEGRGFSLKIPENFIAVRDVDGKELIAYETGNENYTDSPFHIQIGLQKLEAEITGEQFKEIIESQFCSQGIDVEVVDINGNSVSIIEQAGVLGTPIYHIGIHSLDNYFQLRITFNVNFDNMLEVRDLIMNSFKIIDNYAEFEDNINEQLESQKAALVGANSRINALYLLKLFQEDLLFFGEGEIGFDNNKHYMKGIQFNSEVVDNYPVVIQNAQLVAEGLNEVINTIEKNNNLQLSLDEIDEELHEFLLEEDMTALTLMNLFTYKLLIIGQEDDSNIVIAADIRVTSGIPNGKDYIKELIKSLLEYNEIDVSKIQITVIGMRNLDV